MKVKLVWATPDADQLIGMMARVSNPSNQGNEDVEGLIKYMVKHQHWSPFEMVNMCVEITTTRDIARQILRHRSFSFQEFSQRYASTEALPAPALRECRIQDTKNRQNSLPADEELSKQWARMQGEVERVTRTNYLAALDMGIAKEQARALLPEGLTTSRMYMNGTLRSWLHYIALRTDNGTQKEHRQIAERCAALLTWVAPTVMGVL